MPRMWSHCSTPFFIFPQKLNHTLYEVHWVWGGNTLESKRQNMRDAQRFHDPPEYYSGPRLLTFDLVVPQVCCVRVRPGKGLAAGPRAVCSCGT